MPRLYTKNYHASRDLRQAALFELFSATTSAGVIPSDLVDASSQRKVFYCSVLCIKQDTPQMFFLMLNRHADYPAEVFDRVLVDEYLFYWDEEHASINGPVQERNPVWV